MQRQLHVSTCHVYIGDIEGGSKGDLRRVRHSPEIRQSTSSGFSVVQLYSPYSPPVLAVLPRYRLDSTASTAENPDEVD